MSSENRQPVRDPAQVHQDSLLRLLFPALVFLLPLSLYYFTLCPTYFPGDGAELAAAAFSLGIPHPTGYPLFMMLGHGFQKLNPASPAFAMNVMCAIFSALACLAVYRLMRELGRQALGRRISRSIGWCAASAAAALAVGAGRVWWDQSNQTEVYGLAMLFIASGWLLGLRLIRKRKSKNLLVLALLSGVSFLHHQLFLITLPLSLIGLVQWARYSTGGRAQKGRLFLLACLLFLLPLSGYLYLPLRARSEPAINAGNPHDLKSVVWHLTGGQYRQARVLTRSKSDGSIERIPLSALPEHFSRRAGQVVVWVGDQLIGEVTESVSPRSAVFGLVWILAAGLGLGCLWRSSRLAAVGLFGSLALNFVIVATYSIADIAVYQLPIWMLVVALAVLGPVAIVRYLPADNRSRAASKNPQNRAAIAAFVLILLLGGAVKQGLRAENGIDKSRAWQAEEYGELLLQMLPPNAVLFTGGDYDIYPLWYEQVCNGLRPDVAVIGSNFVFSRWYAAMLRQSLPSGVEVFVGDEPASDKGRWLVAWLGGMVAPQIAKGHPVFTTSFDPDVAKHFQLIKAFDLPNPVPHPEEGSRLTIFRLVDPDGFHLRARETFEKWFPDHEPFTVR